MYTYIVIDDESLIRKGTIKKLQPMEDRITCIGEADNGKAGIELIQEGHPDIVILDMQMPIMGGKELLPYLAENYPDMPLIVISGYQMCIRDSIKAVKIAITYIQTFCVIFFIHISIIMRKGFTVRIIFIFDCPAVSHFTGRSHPAADDVSKSISGFHTRLYDLKKCCLLYTSRCV